MVSTEAPVRLLNRNFLLLLQGVFVSQLGSQSFFIVLLLWFQEKTGSASLVALSAVAATAPRIVLGPLGGTLADRYSRRNILVLSELVGGLAILAFGILLFFDPLATAPTAVGLIAVTALLGSTAAVFSPAMAAAIPDLVPTPRVSGANSLIQSAVQVTGLVAQGLGGVLFRVVGVPLFAVLNGVGHLLSATSHAFIRLPPSASTLRIRPEQDTAGWAAQTAEGFHYVRRRPGLRALFLTVGFLSLFTSPVPVLLPFYVERQLGTGAEWFGFLLAAFSSGALVGYAFAGATASPGRNGTNRMLGILIALSLLLGALGMVSSPWGALAVFGLSGALDGFLYVEILTLVQTASGPDIRGRVLALLRTVLEGVAPLAMGLAGVAADLLDHNVTAIFLACGVGLASLSIVMAVRGDLGERLADKEVKLSSKGAKPVS